jgi:DNA polymerase III subunit alpha
MPLPYSAGSLYCSVYTATFSFTHVDMLLNCHTFYSLCYGTYAVRDLLRDLQQCGYTTFALTDINNTSACLDTIRLAPEYGLRCVVGIDIRNQVQQQYVAIALNNEGFRELNEFVSPHLHQQRHFDCIAPEFSQVYVIYPLAQYKGWTLKPNERIGISMQDLTMLPFSPYRHQRAQMVVLHTVSFAAKRQFNAHRLLRAIDTNVLLSKLQVSQQASGHELMLPRTLLQDAFEAYPDIVRQTDALLHDCTIAFTYGKLANKNLSHYTDSRAGDAELLRRECMRGLPYRYPNPTSEVMQRIEKELEVITQLNFASYFLINWDIVRYAQHMHYYYVGRGSGANSIVAYLLRITDVDPIALDLYFERFINLYRNNAPDFDMDFSWTDRDDITRYIFERFGKQRTALLGSYNTFQHDAVIRELGKVFGLPSSEIDRLQHSDIRSADEMGRLVLRYSELIQGFPNHLSIHSSGIIISEAPISTYTATFMPPKGYPTTQFSMLEAEDIGLYKFDILSQRGLGKIKDTLQIIQQQYGVRIDIHAIDQFKQDEQVKVMLRRGQTMGCFYVESPAMRMLLTKLRADDYLRLVAASSIIRPGVSKSGMMREYIVRYRDETLRQKAREQLPALYDILEETYGVMVYQEDVIKIAHLFAGLTLAEADYLRRGMSWKFKQRSEFGAVKDHFYANCRQKGYAENLITDIWTQIESFANFAFSKGHSASYAVESYQAMFLKAYYPLEYMTATLNNGGGFYRPEFYVHEARMHGAVICPPSVNHSTTQCVIEGNTIYLALSMISDLEQGTILQIIRERNDHGLFHDLYDFVRRVPLSIEQMRLLIRAGCFAFTQRSKKELLWEVHAIVQPVNRRQQQDELFHQPPPQWQLPALEHSAIEEAYDQIELWGFPLCSPFLLLRDPVNSVLRAAHLTHFIGQEICICGYLVTYKPTRTAKGERMNFGTFIDIDGAWIDTVHFPSSAKQFPFTGKGCYDIRGKVVEEYDFICIEVSYLKRLPMQDREVLSTKPLSLIKAESG